MSRMKILVFLLFLLVATLPRPAAAGPSLVVEKTVFDFGQIYQGEELRHVFEIRNAGDAPLVVERIKTSCGCTAALLSEKTLPPGGTAEVTANFDSDRFRGSVKKTIYLYTNDPGQAVTKLFLQGRVVAEIILRPEVLQLASQPEGTTRDVSLEIFNEGATPLGLTKVETTSPEVKAKASAGSVPPGGKATLQVTVTPKKGTERINAYVLLETDNPRQPMLRVPVFVNVKD